MQYILNSTSAQIGKVVAGVPRLYDHKKLRLSYVSWQEGVRPLVVVELLSPSTRNEDLGNT